MNTLERLLRGLSCPHEEVDEGLSAFVATTHASESLRSFLEQYGLELAKRSEGLVELLQTELAAGLDRHTAWDPAFAQVFRAIQTSDVGSAPLHAAAVG